MNSFLHVMGSQDSGLVNDMLVKFDLGWSCPFSFCLRFGTNMRSFNALRDHIYVHFWRSRSECLSEKRGVRVSSASSLAMEMVMRRLCKTYRVGSRCRNRDCVEAIVVSEGLLIFVLPELEAPFLKENMTIKRDQTTLEDVYDVFKPFDEVPEVSCDASYWRVNYS